MDPQHPEPSTSHQEECLSPKKKRQRVAFSATEKLMIRNVYKHVIGEASASCPIYESPKTSDCVSKTAEILGIGLTAVYSVLKECKENSPFKSPEKPGPKKTFKEKLDDFTKSAIRRKVHQFFYMNEAPTVKKILNTVNDDPDLPNFSWCTMRKILKHLGFKYATKSRKSVLIDRQDIVLWRQRYLHKIKEYRREGRYIYYQDETWVNEVVAACCCNADVEPRRVLYKDHEFQRTGLGDAVDRVSMKMLREVYNGQSDKNLVVSPLAVQILLAMYSAGTGADSEATAEIVKALGATNSVELFDEYNHLIHKFAQLNPDTLTVANKVYVSKDDTVNPKFRQIVTLNYNGEVENIDLGNLTAAAATINQWANRKSKGHIKDPVAAKDLDNVAAALFNVIFFQGHWHVPFKANETQEKDFHVDKTKTVKKPMMHLERPLFVAESKELNAKVVELPYIEKGFRMVIVLPNEVDGLPSLLDKVAKNGVLKEVFSIEPSGRDVWLDVPKFDVKTIIDLNEILPKIGVSRIFKDPAAEIVNRPVVVSKAFQNAFIKVNEEGSTAGAFTGILSLGAPRPMELKVDHPFLFAILYEDITLFVGTHTH